MSAGSFEVQFSEKPNEARVWFNAPDGNRYEMPCLTFVGVSVELNNVHTLTMTTVAPISSNEWTVS